MWYSGISINNVSFGIIENNTIKSNIGGGVGIDSSSNISVKGNNFSENHHGIRCQFSNFTNITSNIFNSDKVGIYLEYYCDYSQIENNTINSNETGIELISNAWQLVPKFVYIADNTITGGSQGIYLRCGTYNTISSNSIYGGVYGIYLDPFQTCGFFLNNTSIINNIIFNNNYGIYLYNSSNNTLTNNTINNNTQYGIYLESSSDNNALINNIIDNNNEGIVLAYSSNASLFNNSLNNNMINFNVIGSDISHFSHNIDTSNTIDGKSTYYLTNCKDLEINESSNAGFVALTSCNNVTIKNLNLTRNGYGILFINTTNSIVFNITLIDNDYGIYLNSSNSTLINIKSHSNNLDFYSTNSFSNAINFNLSSLLINFTSKDIAFKPATNPGNIPQGYNHIGKFINITNNSADSCIYLNVSYKDDEVSGINESTLRIWKYNDSWYNCSNFASECGVDTVNNVVYANITSFSIFAPLGIDLPPTIENVSITSKTSNSATIIWQTNEPSNSTIYYGTDLNLSDNMTNSSFVINHSITLTGLSASTTYYFNITSCDVAGNCNTSGYYNFTTLSAPTGGGGGAGGGRVGGGAGGIVIPPPEKWGEMDITEGLTKNKYYEGWFEKRTRLLFMFKYDLHHIDIEEVKENYVDISLHSLPIYDRLYINDSKTYDLDGDKKADILVKLIEISKNLTAHLKIYLITCECPEPSDWSECREGKQTRTIYECTKNTNYTCIAKIEERECKEEIGVEKGKEKKIEKKRNWAIILTLIILVILIILSLLIPKIKERKKKDIEKKVKFYK